MSTPEDERTVKAQAEAIKKLREEIDTESLRDVEPIEYSGLSRWEVREAWDAREEERERLERERGDRS